MMTPLLRRLLGDPRGTSAIEFAIIAPVLAVMTMGIADLSMGLARKFQLEQASYRALELVTVGTVVSDYSYVKTEAVAAAEVPAENVVVTTWLECNGAKQTDFNTTCPSEEQTARFLTVTVVDDYEPIFAYGPFTGAVDGKVRLTSRSTIRMQ